MEIERSRACCCMANLLATKIIAILSILIHFISIGNDEILTFHFDDFYFLGFAFYISFFVSDEETSRQVLMIYGAIITIIVLFCLYFDILLLIGSFKKKEWMLLVWLVFAILRVFLVVVNLTLLDLVFGFGLRRSVTAVIVIGIIFLVIWCAVVIVYGIKEISAFNRQELFSLHEFEVGRNGRNVLVGDEETMMSVLTKG